MKLVNVTNSHSRLVLNQLEDTGARLVKVCIAGNAAIVYTEAPKHSEILLINNKHKIQPKEIGEAKNYFLGEIKDIVYHEDGIEAIELARLVEISIPKHELDATSAV